MDYSSPYQFDMHWVQRVQKEEKCLRRQPQTYFEAKAGKAARKNSDFDVSLVLLS